MEITKETVQHVAKVARITLTAEQAKKFSKQLQDVLTNFKVLDSCDTNGLEPAFHPIDIKDRMQNDVPRECLSHEEAMKNVKAKVNGYIKGPSILLK